MASLAPSQIRHKRFEDRIDYLQAVRNPIVVVSFATADTNVAGMLRSCEAAMVEKVYLSQTLRDRRAACSGADKWQPHEVGLPRLGFLKAMGYTVVGLEIAHNSTRLGDTFLPERMALVVGNESYGIPDEVLRECDIVVEIPQFGFVNCLNVTVATSIALYEWARQHRGGE